MLFDKSLIRCKTQQNKKEIIHRIEYQRALSKTEAIRYRLINGIMDEHAIIVDIDTSLFTPQIRFNPTEYIEQLIKQIEVYGFQYKISKTNKEILDTGLNRMFGMKSSKSGKAYRVSIYIPYVAFTTKCYQDLLEKSGYSICVLKEDSDVGQLLELFYSGMIDDLNFTEIFYAHFYFNEQIAQFLVATEHISQQKMNTLLTELKTN